MNRYECFEFLAPLVNDQLVLGSLSGQRVEWGHLSRHEVNLLVASMGAAFGIGIGFALVLPHRKVLVFESDGSMLLSLYNLPTLGNFSLPILWFSSSTMRFIAARGSASLAPLPERPISRGWPGLRHRARIDGT